ncbi:hypothetical protein COU37_03955 [Candidatus Micrarchaeota archaeon CG10_big_fil_rev_8_21_14_0_10_45_29]|nr:MAG: hypothetical protein COU37_03955 [Candidatus Micrarchaeota archaeon CG10_big_fil_rev_8_21_14_0_10_45_29]
MKTQIIRLEPSPTDSSALKAKIANFNKISVLLEENAKSMKEFDFDKKLYRALGLLDDLKKDNQERHDNTIKDRFKSGLMQEFLSKQPANFGVPEAKLIKKNSTDGKELEAKIYKANKFSRALETEMKYSKIFEDALNYLQGYDDATKDYIRAHDNEIKKLNTGISGFVSRLFGI